MRTINRTIGTPARLSLALGLLAAALGVASAAPLPAQPGLGADQSLVTQVKKGKHHHHGYRPWVGVGGGIVLGTAYCSAQSASCAEEYGARTYRYWRCMRRAGCDW